MNCSVNGEAVSEEIIAEEIQRLARDPAWPQITGEAERAARLREAAEHRGWTGF